MKVEASVISTIEVVRIDAIRGPEMYKVFAGKLCIASVQYNFNGKWEYRCRLPGFKQNTVILSERDKIMERAQSRLSAWLGYINQERDNANK
ncbi:hypothetical protein HWC21_gp088 [Vibrio phage VAP7]|uniref:Uncharacterized protein n=1 Tax=Vibrio phage VAP7 TaxID=2584487 RepID=A0A4Y5TV68_9CAUD|nr:hypothetical protein HWC21_gp088 [Vibrio phage VAP7]QDB73270.1 hypothetical protein [Vibrio phage VAP7]UFD98045.1 hypothetical protein [Vibrio phage BX-1]